MSRFTGVHTALVTPFDKNGEIDFSALYELVAMQRMAGVDGLVLAGTTGEAPTLSVAERKALVGMVKDQAGPMAITAGAGSNCTKTAIELQKAMEDAGADATLQVVPYYNKPTQKGIIEHFLAIDKEAFAPIILYNASGRTGIEMAPATVAAIAKGAKNVIGIKDANTDAERLDELICLSKEARPDFLVLCGEDAAFSSFLAMGGHGIISVASHIAASEMLSIYRHASSGDLPNAQRISQRIRGLCKLLFSHPNPIPIKTILFAMGLIKRSFRLPLCSLSEAEEEALLAKVKRFSFLQSFEAKGHFR